MVDLRAPGPLDLTLTLYNTVKTCIDVEPLCLRVKLAGMLFVKELRTRRLKRAHNEGDDCVPVDWELSREDCLDDLCDIDIAGM